MLISFLNIVLIGLLLFIKNGTCISSSFGVLVCRYKSMFWSYQYYKMPQFIYKERVYLSPDELEEKKSHSFETKQKTTHEH